jgi:hypothetical protein
MPPRVLADDPGSILEVQKLAWVLTRVIPRCGLVDPLKLEFVAERYGPYAHQLTHLLNALDGSYLHCDKRLADASPFDAIYFEADRAAALRAYLATSDGAPFIDAINETDALIDGFQSPLGMEALATVDWLLTRERIEPALASVREALDHWPGGESAGQRKQRLFTDKLLLATLDRLHRFANAA